MANVFYALLRILDKTPALEYKRGTSTTMGRRRHQRYKKELTVSIRGTDSMGKEFSQSASVVDVSESGVRLQGVHVLYRPGQTAILEHNGVRAQYRVVWVGAGALAGQAGLMNLEPSKSIFNLRFPPSGPDKYVVPPTDIPEFDTGSRQFDDSLRRLVEQRRRAERRKDERRRYPRFSVRGEAEVYSTGSSFPARGRLTDLSMGGCFVELLSALTMDMKVTVVLLIAQRRIRVLGVVKSVLTNFGLGIQFQHYEPEDLKMMEEVLAALEQGTALEELPPPTAAPAAAPVQPAAMSPDHTDSDATLEAVKSWFGDHDYLSRQEFLALLKKVATKV